jgi:chromosome segregation ATPase
MFGQVVKNWEEKLSLLSRQIEALSVKEEELKERIAAVDRKVVADCLSREEWIRDTVKTQTQIERLEARMVSQFDRIMDRIGGSNVTK